jgi:uncharacterized OB-fold protein
MTTSLARPLPAATRDNIPFWTGGANGELLIQACDACSYLIHPPTGFCPRCESRATHMQAVSGRATVETFTIVHQQWLPNLQVPYVIAMLQIAEQDDVRLISNIVDCPPESVTIGMEVAVQFEQAEDLWVPLFAPVENGQ